MIKTSKESARSSGQIQRRKGGDERSRRKEVKGRDGGMGRGSGKSTKRGVIPVNNGGAEGTGVRILKHANRSERKKDRRGGHARGGRAAGGMASVITRGTPGTL